MNTVASRIRRKARCASNFGSNSIGLPLRSAQCVATKRPCTWKVGSMCSSTSPGRKPQYSCSTSALAARLRWVSIAPFERPVVPEVYRMAARSLPADSVVEKASGISAAAAARLPSPRSPRSCTSGTRAAQASSCASSSFSGRQTKRPGLASSRKYTTSPRW
jgi:hypothetical protein